MSVMVTNEIYAEIYKMAAEIPAGTVMTYGQIALYIGKPGWARLVARAMSETPDDLGIPCHRVINAKGEMSPDFVFGGRHIQRKMLEDEGVVFKANGCVDLKKSML